MSKFEVLYDANVERGQFASGIITLYNENNQQILKKEGVLDLNKVKLDDRCDYFIGHVQAPTSVKRSWSFDTSHPFEAISWAVVHNGVLTNWKEIRAKHPDWDVSPVDTSVIPNLLQFYTETQSDLTQSQVIKKVLTEIEGTFAVCIVDTDCNDVYIARQGSVLHYNEQGEFCTLGGNGFKMLPEGIILRLRDYKHWDVVETFEVKSPFVFI